MGRRYSALRTIGNIYKVLGIISGVITVLIVIAFCATSVLGGAALNSISKDLGGGSGFGGLFGGVVGGVVGSLIAILYGGGLAVTLYGFGEAIYLLIALEENTRATASALKAIAATTPEQGS